MLQPPWTSKREFELVNLRFDRRLTPQIGELHIWRADLHHEEHSRGLEPLLAPNELQRANRFRFPEHRQRFIVARGCLRQLLASYLQIDEREVEFTYAPEGKPSLSFEHGSGLTFNVSHSGDIAVFAFTMERRIGVDVEMIRHDVDIDQIPKRFFSPAEQEMLLSLEPQQRYQAFFNCWTRKESYVKAVGSGLSLPLRDFDVSLRPGEPARLLATRPDAAAASHWSMGALDLDEACAAAVVVEGAIAKLEVQSYIPFS